MYKKIWVLAFAVMFACTSSQGEKDNKKAPPTIFFENLNSVVLPLYIIGDRDVEIYDDIIMNDQNDFVANPILKPIDCYEFIKDKYTIDGKIKYYGVFKNQIDNFYLVWLIQDNRAEETYRLMLNLFDLNGRLLDTLYVAGRSMPEFRRLCSISCDLHIRTYYFLDVVDDLSKHGKTDFNFYATEIRNDYVISDEGKFVLIKEIKERGYFTLWGERDIVSRVDTIDGKYRFKYN